MEKKKKKRVVKKKIEDTEEKKKTREKDKERVRAEASLHRGGLLLSANDAKAGRVSGVDVEK